MMLTIKLLYLLYIFAVISAQNQTENSTTEVPKNGSSKLVGETFYSRINNKLPPVEDTKEVPKWFHTKQLIFLLSGIGVCCVLLIGLSLPKYCTNYTQNGRQCQQLLIEPENAQEATFEEQTLLSSDEEEFTTPPVLRIN